MRRQLVNWGHFYCGKNNGVNADWWIRCDDDTISLPYILEKAVVWPTYPTWSAVLKTAKKKSVDCIIHHQIHCLYHRNLSYYKTPIQILIFFRLKWFLLNWFDQFHCKISLFINFFDWNHFYCINLISLIVKLHFLSIFSIEIIFIELDYRSNCII